MINRYTHSNMHWIEFAMIKGKLMYRDAFSDGKWDLSSHATTLDAHNYFTNAGYAVSFHYDPNDLQIDPNAPPVDADGNPIKTNRIPGYPSMQQYIDDWKNRADANSSSSAEVWGTVKVDLPKSNKCQCPMRDLMMRGCTCGGK